MSGSNQYERDVIRNLQKMTKSLEEISANFVIIGKLLKEHFSGTTDPSELKASVEQLIELKQTLEKLEETDNKKLDAIEWMDYIGVHYEFVDPNQLFSLRKITRDEFWQLIEKLAESGQIRQTKPEPVKDANQLELPEIVIDKEAK